MIKISNLTKKYGDFTAVDDISMIIDKGELFGLLGPNGAGKSTTVSMLSTVLYPTSGEIRVNNKPIQGNEKEIKSKMGIVPQELALYETMSAKDNLHFFGSLYGLSGKKLKNRADEVLEIIELKDKSKQVVSKFSGGMKRRVNIGIALMHNPQVLIFDEPTVGIDPQSRNHILGCIKKLNKEQGITVIYTSHYMEEVEFLCNRVGIIDYGKLIALGTKEELKNNTNACDMLEITCSQTSGKALENIKEIKGVERMSINENSIKLFIIPNKRNAIEIVEDIKAVGIEINNFKYEEVNLETIFLQLTGKSLRE